MSKTPSSVAPGGFDATAWTQKSVGQERVGGSVGAVEADLGLKHGVLLANVTVAKLMNNDDMATYRKISDQLQ
ncbi:hypothetical protein [Pseudarthrobacter sulfonivorans]|nr:hypothetical protein [Pseudarthrobacter sulfonivorans]